MLGGTDDKVNRDALKNFCRVLADATMLAETASKKN